MGLTWFAKVRSKHREQRGIKYAAYLKGRDENPETGRPAVLGECVRIARHCGLGLSSTDSLSDEDWF